MTEHIDTCTAGGTLIVQIYWVLAEHERNVLHERTKAGLTAARIRGRTGGRPIGVVSKYEEIKYFVKDTYDKRNATKEVIQNYYNANRVKNEGIAYSTI